MKRIVCIICTLLCNVSTYAQKSGEFAFYVHDSLCGMLIYEASPVVNNKFVVDMSVEWMKSNFTPVRNDTSLLVLTRENVKWSNDRDIKCGTLEKNNEIIFGEKTKLEFSVEKTHKKGIVDFTIDPKYRTTTSVEKDLKNFTFTRPRHVELSMQIDEYLIKDVIPPVLTIVKPYQDGSRHIVNTSSVTVVLEATDYAGIAAVLVNGKEAKYDGNNLYSVRVPLRTGNNKLKVIVYDPSGNYTQGSLQVKTTFQDRVMIESAKYHALFISVNEYPDESIESINFPSANAKALRDVLVREYTFEHEDIRMLENPTKQTLTMVLDTLKQTLTANDNLLIYYAGRGFWDARKEVGYWWTSDAKKTKRTNWVSNKTINKYIEGIPAKNTLLISDACFNGSVFNSKVKKKKKIGLKTQYEKSSRKAMVSGVRSEMPDGSVFLEFLTLMLNKNRLKYIPAKKLFDSFIEVLLFDSQIVPKYGTIRNAGDKGGDFIFIRK